MSDGRQKSAANASAEISDQAVVAARMDDGSDDLAAGAAPKGAAEWEAQLVRARSESVIDGRSDWAGERYYAIATDESAPPEVMTRALNGLSELSEAPDGRVPRRLLAQYYMQLGDPLSVDQLHSLSLRIGGQREREQVLAARFLRTLDAEMDFGQLVPQALARVDARRVGFDDIGNALLRAWRETPSTTALLTLAAQAFEDGEQYDLALRARLLFLEYADEHDMFAVESQLARALRQLDAGTPEALLRYAHQNRKHPELRARAALVLDAQRTSPRVQQAQGQPAPTTILRRANLRAPDFESEITDRRPSDPKDDAQRLAFLETRLKEDPKNPQLLQLVANEHRVHKRYEEELAMLGELAQVIGEEPGHADLPDVYRRSAELLLHLGDTDDALRLRAEAIYLSNMQADDQHFLLSNVDSESYEKLLEVLRGLIANTIEDNEVQLALLAAELLVEHDDAIDAAWALLYPAWERYPNDRLASARLVTLSTAVGKQRELLAAVRAFAKEGSFRDERVIDVFRTLAHRLEDNETLIALAVNSAVAAPLDAETRRRAKNVLLAQGYSLATGASQVLALLHDVHARKAWSFIAATALETEGRFEEAADVLLALYTVDTRLFGVFDRAVQNLERGQLWERAFGVAEEELSRANSPYHLINTLRYMRRLATMSGEGHQRVKDTAVRVALDYAHDYNLDAHARAELTSDQDCPGFVAYLEERARRTSDRQLAGDLYLEAADTLATNPDCDRSHLQRLLAAAKRSGVSVADLNTASLRRTRSKPRPAPKTTTTPSVITDREEMARALWRSLVDTGPHLHAERTASFLEVSLLKRTHQRAVQRRNSVIAHNAGELRHWLHPAAASRNDAEASEEPALPADLEALIDALPGRIRGFLSRIGIRGELRDRVLESLGDPLDAVANTDASGRNAALIKYTRARLPEMRARVEESLHDEAHEPLQLLELLPWVIAAYALGGLREIYHDLAEHLQRPEAQNLEELIQQMSDKPLIAQLFAEWVYLTQSPNGARPTAPTDD